MSNQNIRVRPDGDIADLKFGASLKRLASEEASREQLIAAGASNVIAEAGRTLGGK